MMHFLSSLLWLAATAVPVADQAGCLCHAGKSGQVQTETYVPREGDILIFTYCNGFSRLLYELAGTGPPYHAGIVVRLPDGRLATLEAGPTDNWRVYLLTLPTRLPAYQGRIWVRRIKKPLEPEESARLTEFATNQTDKGFAFGRVLLGATVMRPRGDLGVELFGQTSLERDEWFCSELVVAACVAAGRLDRQKIPANGVYPRDLFLDDPISFSATWEPPLLWTEHSVHESVQTIIQQQSLEDEEQEVLAGKK
jgi:hypothetical protein